MIAVLGAGAWGTALAAHLARASDSRQVLLWSRRAELPAALTGLNVSATADLSALKEAGILLLCTPAQSLRDLLPQLKPHLTDKTILVNCAKGIDRITGQLLSEMAAACVDNEFCILSGPSFADEVADNKPAALTLAAAKENVGAALLNELAAPSFRLYLSDDITGVQLGGAVKNVIAIACGITIGAQLGENARAALITRGLAEMMRLADSLGARRETLMGLSGLGDLVLTCGSLQSRNFSFGFQLGQGIPPEDALLAQKGIVEGVATADAILKLAARHQIDMPICQAVHDIVQGRRSIQHTVAHLLARPFKAE